MALNPRAWSVWLAAASWVWSGCDQDEPAGSAAQSQRTEPWGGAQPDGGNDSSNVVHLEIRPTSGATFTLRSKDPKLAGTLRCSGADLDVHLHELARTQGHLRFDLESISVAKDAVPDAELTRKALSWLETSEHRADPANATSNVAQFRVERLEELSVAAAHEGSKVKRAHDGAVETRRVHATAIGQLTLHGFRVERSVRIQVDFDYPGEARPGLTPERVLVRTVRSFPVSLSAHAILPRTGDGHVIAQERAELQQNTGNEAHVTAELFLAPKK